MITLLRQFTCKHKEFFETMACHAICTSCKKDLGFIQTSREDPSRQEVGSQVWWFPTNDSTSTTSQSLRNPMQDEYDVTTHDSSAPIVLVILLFVVVSLSLPFLWLYDTYSDFKRQ